MTEHIWISNCQDNSRLIHFVDTDIATENEKAAIEGQNLNEQGLPVPSELCPKKIWGDGHAPNYKKMPDLFRAMGQWIVSERAADILRQFDLGQGALYPVSDGAYQNDQKTRVPGNYFCWIFGNTKDVFRPESSPNAIAPKIQGGWWNMPWNPKDSDIAVSREALARPDVWLDQMLFKSVFLSGPLGDALGQAGLMASFGLFKCRVI